MLAASVSEGNCVPMRMINVESGKSLDYHHYQRPSHLDHLRQRRGGESNNLRTTRSMRSLLSAFRANTTDFDMEYMDMECGPPLFESSFLFDEFFEKIRPRRDLCHLRRTKTSHRGHSHSSPSSPLSASSSRDHSSRGRIIPIEVKHAIVSISDAPEKSKATHKDTDSVIEIDDEDSCSVLGEDTNSGRKPLSRSKSRESDDVISFSCVENNSPVNKKKSVETFDSSQSGQSKGKDTLIGGANKYHPSPDDAVLVLDDVAMDPSSLGLHKKELAQCQGQSSSQEDLGVVSGAPPYPVYTALKEKLASECRQIDYIRGDGNCFFRAVSKHLYGNEKFHKTIRNLIVDLIATNKSSFAQFVDGEDVQDHVERMCQEQSWATTCEIYAASTLLQRDIYMLTPDHLNETYSWLLFKPVFQCETQESGENSDTCYLSMCNTNGNHYDRIVPEHGGCNCFLPHPELDGVSYCLDLTEES